MLEKPKKLSLADYLEHFRGLYKDQLVSIDATVVDGRYAPINDLLARILVACLLQRSRELQLDIADKEKQLTVYNRHDVLFFTAPVKEREKKYRAVIESLKGKRVTVGIEYNTHNKLVFLETMIVNGIDFDLGEKRSLDSFLEKLYQP